MFVSLAKENVHKVTGSESTSLELLCEMLSAHEASDGYYIAHKKWRESHPGLLEKTEELLKDDRARERKKRNGGI